jgi:hypothetical protein
MKRIDRIMREVKSFRAIFFYKNPVHPSYPCETVCNFLTPNFKIGQGTGVFIEVGVEEGESGGDR